MSALLTDFYQLTMLQAYLHEGLEEEAVFELFVRKLPPNRCFLVAAGLEQALDYLEDLRFDDSEIAWLVGRGGFPATLAPRLRELRFTGDVHAMPEGTVFFPDEPILRVTAPLPQAQLVESRLLNIVHFQTLIASKAARMRTAARDKTLIDFGMRRAHGAEASVFAARAAWLAGFDGTATAEAGRRFEIPVVGTMAHSFVQAHASEAGAFEAFARSRPLRPTMLVDTYDSEAAVAKLIAIAPRLKLDGIAIGGVRLDSGDLGAHARAVRSMLDAADLADVIVFASGNLDEHRIATLLQDGAPIDGFGVGTALGTSSDAPALDMVYKLQSYAGIARRKRSEGKATWPGVKQVSRRLDGVGCLAGDLVHLVSESAPGVALLQPCMRAGRRLQPTPTLDQVRERHVHERSRLQSALLLLDAAPAGYGAEISAGLRHLAAQVDSATC
ncbi:MAG TPA: nicotinate phosphoribosyltransferase [Ideonella sp.]|uniref:nicotinate phosphoribosyltransferase n=1 Tax=Ideonella sp. TaxID=1929293 RepID=UPI002E3439AD|nr:nicotinate phosphoribosyltransferase [Ideonella sp.]HEX5685031.1 nicotinate phosphoribosyltransferase [Ideonella sp.]